MSTFPAFALAKQRDTYARSVNGLASESTKSWLDTGVLPSFQVTSDSVEADAKLAAKMWINAPVNKMTLASVQKGIDSNADGLIDQDEFKALLAAAGYKGGAANAIFAQMDADGDGTLTEAEIKVLSQGKDTLASSG